MADINQAFSDMASNIVNALPSILAAIIIIIIGFVIGIIAGKLAQKLIKKLGMQKTFDKTTAGKAFISSGMDIANVVGGLVTAFVTILGVVLGIQMLNIGGTVGSYLISIASYLPRLLGGIAIISFWISPGRFTCFIYRKHDKTNVYASKSHIADMLKNLLFIGLIAFILLLALDVMLLSGSTIYPLILGFVIIAAGIALTDGLIKSLTDDHEEFKGVAGYAKFVLYSIFLIIGAGGIFATFPGVTGIISNISWGFAIALAIMLIPIAYSLAKRMSKENKE